MRKSWRQAVATIRRVDPHLLRRILDLLDDQRTRRELASCIEELDQRTAIDPDRIGETLWP